MAGNQAQQIHAALEQQGRQIQALLNEQARLKRKLEKKPRTLEEDLASIPGRRLFYGLAGRKTFDDGDQGKRGDPITMTISQDGPFIQTHFPIVMWRPTAPSNGTNFKRWSPVASSPLPAQEISNLDLLDISFEIQDSGTSRNFQNESLPPMFSDHRHPTRLPEVTLFEPNSTISFFPFYERVFFNGSAATPTTKGELVVALPGYRIVNM